MKDFVLPEHQIIAEALSRMTVRLWPELEVRSDDI